MTPTPDNPYGDDITVAEGTKPGDPFIGIIKLIVMRRGFRYESNTLTFRTSSEFGKKLAINELKAWYDTIPKPLDPQLPPPSKRAFDL